MKTRTNAVTALLIASIATVTSLPTASAGVEECLDDNENQGDGNGSPLVDCILENVTLPPTEETCPDVAKVDAGFFVYEFAGMRDPIQEPAVYPATWAWTYAKEEADSGPDECVITSYTLSVDVGSDHFEEWGANVEGHGWEYGYLCDYKGVPVTGCSVSAGPGAASISGNVALLLPLSGNNV